MNPLLAKRQESIKLTQEIACLNNLQLNKSKEKRDESDSGGSLEQDDSKDNDEVKEILTYKMQQENGEGKGGPKINVLGKYVNFGKQ